MISKVLTMSLLARHGRNGNLKRSVRSTEEPASEIPHDLDLLFPCTLACFGCLNCCIGSVRSSPRKLRQQPGVCPAKPTWRTARGRAPRDAAEGCVQPLYALTKKICHTLGRMPIPARWYFCVSFFRRCGAFAHAVRLEWVKIWLPEGTGASTVPGGRPCASPAKRRRDAHIAASVPASPRADSPSASE